MGRDHAPRKYVPSRIRVSRVGIRGDSQGVFLGAMGRRDLLDGLRNAPPIKERGGHASKYQKKVSGGVDWDSFSLRRVKGEER